MTTPERRKVIERLQAEGRQAFVDGKSSCAVPREYNGTMNVSHWEYGWREAEQEALERATPESEAPVVKSCPFCGNAPVRHGVTQKKLCCLKIECPCFTSLATPNEWNTRAKLNALGFKIPETLDDLQRQPINKDEVVETRSNFTEGCLGCDPYYNEGPDHEEHHFDACECCQAFARMEKERDIWKNAFNQVRDADPEVMQTLDKLAACIARDESKAVNRDHLFDEMRSMLEITTGFLRTEINDHMANITEPHERRKAIALNIGNFVARSEVLLSKLRALDVETEPNK